MQRSQVIEQLRMRWRDLLDNLSIKRCEIADQEALQMSAIVFSPHFDDETLGCGGTVARKVRAGSTVQVVFMTNGSKSHRHLMDENELSKIRRTEAINATRNLGLTESQVYFLNHEETQLAVHADKAVQGAAEILRKHPPREIFVPYLFQNAPSDHAATNRIAQLAVKVTGQRVIINEYPIWFWHHWPFVRVAVPNRRDLLAISFDSLVRNLQLILRFNYAVEIEDLHDVKQRALDEYRSQMTRLVSDQRWLTLADVSEGEFLRRFFQTREIFSRHYP